MHNRALMSLDVAWAKQQELMDQEATWYQQKRDRGTVLENDKTKLVWDFEFHIQKTNIERRRNLILELKN